MIDVSKIDLTPLYDGAAELVRMYRDELELQKVNASGSLSRSADFDVDFNEDNIVLYFIYNSYGYYINEGRRPTGGGGGQSWSNSVQEISDWMRNKMSRGWFIPHRNNKIPRTDKEIKSVAYAIVRKIHKEGFYSPNHQGLHILQTVLDKADANGLIDRMIDSVVKQYDKEVTVEIEKL